MGCGASHSSTTTKPGDAPSTPSGSSSPHTARKVCGGSDDPSVFCFIDIENFASLPPETLQDSDLIPLRRYVSAKEVTWAEVASVSWNWMVTEDCVEDRPAVHSDVLVEIHRVVTQIQKRNADGSERKIPLRYLWIDTVCLKQDGDLSAVLEIMSNFYRDSGHIIILNTLSGPTPGASEPPLPDGARATWVYNLGEHEGNFMLDDTCDWSGLRFHPAGVREVLSTKERLRKELADVPEPLMLQLARLFNDRFRDVATHHPLRIGHIGIELLCILEGPESCGKWTRHDRLFKWLVVNYISVFMASKSQGFNHVTFADCSEHLGGPVYPSRAWTAQEFQQAMEKEKQGTTANSDIEIVREFLTTMLGAFYPFSYASSSVVEYALDKLAQVMSKLQLRDMSTTLDSSKSIKQHLAEIFMLLSQPPLTSAEKDELVRLRQNATGNAYTIHSSLWYCESFAKELSLVLDRDFVDYLIRHPEKKLLSKSKIEPDSSLTSRVHDFQYDWTDDEDGGGKTFFEGLNKHESMEPLNTLLGMLAFTGATKTSTTYEACPEMAGRTRFMSQISNGIATSVCQSTGFPGPRHAPRIAEEVIGEKARFARACNTLLGMMRGFPFQLRFARPSDGAKRNAHSVLHALEGGGMASRYLCDSYNMMVKMCAAPGQEGSLVPYLRVRDETLRLVREVCHEWCRDEWSEDTDTLGKQATPSKQQNTEVLIQCWMDGPVKVLDLCNTRMYWEDVVCAMVLGLLTGAVDFGASKKPSKGQNFMGVGLNVHKEVTADGRLQYEVSAHAPCGTKRRSGRYSWGHDLVGHNMQDNAELSAKLWAEETRSRVAAFISFLCAWLHGNKFDVQHCVLTQNVTMVDIQCAQQADKNSQNGKHLLTGINVSLKFAERMTSEATPTAAAEWQVECTARNKGGTIEDVKPVKSTELVIEHRHRSESIADRNGSYMDELSKHFQDTSRVA
mmetsp:Transcript_20282/g.50665  ORF Transcript_20282/g.50665 Transcript_20282/m.50665 type:complete len:959 (+) Transcript_20282:165-3041(+)|eukprot:CAMPEP_0197597950 /NCGR_PEP_ID=MMETSP1326-20131121/28304_1 /TAXON_ID=1155430 /ORGANISM="Genus nov. species nov., Strain RCC2288" /LENGTH=958 /DNA_ID=CAMNT_0043164687 /DNA_START=149 /DNA_END=3025 /DNA_ORIENTATION=+